jgi:hypothetical protein
MKELVLLIEGSMFFKTASHSLLVFFVVSAPVASAISATFSDDGRSYYCLIDLKRAMAEKVVIS